ncbi:MAG: single-stranded DNA-binding protein [Candidatus Binataceae bacterium]
MANRIELEGRVTRVPELRVTPAGTPVLNFVVECSEGAEKLSLEVVMTGNAAREVAAQLRRGVTVAVKGRLRAVAGRAIGAPGIEVVASLIEARAQT